MDLFKEAEHKEHTDGEGYGTLIAVALISLAALALEVVLTRLFSVLYFPPAVFAILSLAILGMGLGAALVTWRPRWQNPRNLAGYQAAAATAVIGIVAAAVLMGTGRTGDLPLQQAVLFVLVVLPYLFTGMSLTTIFSARPQESSRMYMADLLGAGAGALAAVPLLNWFGGINALLVTAVILALAGLVGRMQGARGRRQETGGETAGRHGGLPLLILILLAGNLAFGWLAIDMSRLPVDKPIAEALDGGGSAAGMVIDMRWDAFARSDLVDPGDGGPYRLYIDGAAGSVMPPAEDNAFLWDDIGLFPFATEQPQRVFLIGPGAGLDVWFALQSGAEEIVGVEVNPASVDLVREQADYNGDLYGRPQVDILVDDGRSVLQREQTQYDLIFLSQLVTLAAERNGYALVENSSYTVEAFHEYLKHLTPEGQIGIKLYDEPTLTRAMSTALAAFREQGLSDQEGLQHILVLLDGNADPPIPLLIINKSAYTREDSLSLGAVAQQVGFTPLFLPGVLAQPPLDGVAGGEESFGDIITSSDNDLSPTTDDRPFFYQFERGIPQALQPLLWSILVVVLIGVVLVGLYQRRRGIGRLAVASPLYFAALGLGFILVEIGVIQQTRLFLGHPTTAVTVVLAILLISGGIGSGISSRWMGDRAAFRVGPILAVIVIAVLWLLLWPFVQDRFLALMPFLRIIIVASGLLPLGLAMGMPFPLGLRAAAGVDRQQVPLAWAVNGVMSVAGSVLAVTVAILFGYSAVIAAGGMAYGVAAAAALLAGGVLSGQG